MGNLRNVGIAEQRVYDNPQNPAGSDYDVALPITVPAAVIDPDTGKNLSAVLNEHATEIAAAKTAAESASNAVGNLSGHTHDDRYYSKTEVDSKLSGKADASHTHSASQISGLPTSLPASGGNADTVGGAEVMATAALGLHQMASGTAAATMANCPVGCWYGQYE